MLQVERMGDVRNAYGNMNANQEHDARLAINAIDFADVWRGAGTIVNQGLVRLDVQGRTAAGEQNLQVQINGVNGNSTVAAALIAESVQNANIEAQRVYAVRKIKDALFSSMNDSHIYRVTGTPT
ncbi:hypothetical protein [Alcanivorax sp.]|uniref:hypothetical protein n=1 Tax=Alcanivorax sp. TaxID=1872427 RepID=UPI000C3DC389|nr:hypothetical protein [Alcanivorax sp.]MBQ25512.1 hypothetical protein [Alcanivorax sp.]|tara:strand:- start:2006 stop:2380 length:375 start_codon:yes stop_codon:yes gene_type:complete